MIHIRVRTADGKILRDLPRDELKAIAKSGGLIWIDLDTPTPEEVEHVADCLSWSHLTTEDLTEQDQRAKMEDYDGYTVLVMHDLRYDRETRVLTTPEVDFVIGANYVASVHYHKFSPIEEARDLDHRLQTVLSNGPDFLLYVLADQLVDGYFPTVDDMHEEVEELEQAILADPNPTLLPQIFDMKRTAVVLRRIISPQMDAFSLLTSPTFGIVKTENLVYFRDIHDHLLRIMEAIDTYRDLMGGVLDAYLSNVSNRMNEIIKRLTVLASLFLPMTFFTGLMGMNLRRAPTWSDPLFWAIVAGMIVLTASQWLYFRMKHWV